MNNKLFHALNWHNLLFSLCLLWFSTLRVPLLDLYANLICCIHILAYGVSLMHQSYIKPLASTLGHVGSLNSTKWSLAKQYIIYSNVIMPFPYQLLEKIKLTHIR
ncbi:hypothetical protein ACJX0J_036329 [Zea mays]